MNELLNQRIEDNIAYEPNTGCWLWIARVTHDGYGVLFHEGKPRLIHRAVYENRFGKIPKGLCALHKCDVRSCVNPDHIFLGTQRDNNLDMAKKGRACKGANHNKAKLDELQAKVIKSLSGELLQKYMAGYFKVLPTAIHCIVKNKTWRHIAMKTYTTPTGPMYIAAKKKGRVTRVIKFLESIKEDLASHPSVLQTITFLKEYRSDLDQL